MLWKSRHTKKKHAQLEEKSILLRGANTTPRAFYRPSKRIFSYQRDNTNESLGSQHIPEDSEPKSVMFMQN
jgi:hypothetical protein